MSTAPSIITALNLISVAATPLAIHTRVYLCMHACVRMHIKSAYEHGSIDNHSAELDKRGCNAISPTSRVYVCMHACNRKLLCAIMAVQRERTCICTYIYIYIYIYIVSVGDKSIARLTAGEHFRTIHAYMNTHIHT